MDRRREASTGASRTTNWSTTAKGAFLTTDKDFGDIELLVEYKTVPLADSGIYLRATPQVQIWDYTQAGGKWNLGADKGSGGLWNNSPGSPGKDPLVLADKPFGQWNKFRILQVGERVTVYLNDKLVVDHARLENYWRGTVKPPKYNRATPLMKKGPIQLQTHGGEIRWRNLFIREIPADEANAILRKHNSEGFVDVFNGRDFSGWAGPVDQYEVKDGAIVCRPNKGGTIYTTDEYSDFVARVEFRLPPAGNNGLAIRYPGYGDGAYIGHVRVPDPGRRRPGLCEARPAAILRLGLRHGGRQPRLPSSRGPVELYRGHGHRPQTNDGTQRHAGHRDRPQPSQRVHGPFGASGQAAEPRSFRLLRPRRPGGVPQRADQEAEVSGAGPRPACQGGEEGWTAKPHPRQAQDPALLARAVKKAGQLRC